MIERIVAGAERHRRLTLVVTLAEPWAHRRFGICFRSADGLSPAGARLVEFLVAAADGSSD